MDWFKKDIEFIWHPFTHLKSAKKPILIERAEGVYYYDQNEKKYIDAISSWWVNLHGHANPYITSKVIEQLNKMEHIMFSGFTHKPAINLAEKLLNHLPSNQKKIFYSDNGSTSVEVALKMALQFWHNKNEVKPLFIAFENAYHGDTFGGMSVGERNVFNNAFDKLLFDVVHMPLPTSTNIEFIRNELLNLISNHPVAGFIFEPLVQGAAGMQIYNASFLDQLIGLCKENNVITIADEVMTGFGRTGKFFASDYLQNKPDIICLSKGLTGGYMALGVTSCAQFIYNEFVSEDKTKTFFHGHSYTANPLACSAALASLDLMETKSTIRSIERINKLNQKFKKKIETHACCKNVRVIGTILALDVVNDESTHYLNSISDIIVEFFVSKGVLLRPLGNVIYIIPPYCIDDVELNHIYNCIEMFLNELKVTLAS